MTTFGNINRNENIIFHKWKLGMSLNKFEHSKENKKLCDFQDEAGRINITFKRMEYKKNWPNP
jgi:hypothetical protein